MKHSTIDRRAMLAGAAVAVPAVALSVQAALPAIADPIFAAIERHRAAYQMWLDSIDIDEDGDNALSKAEHMAFQFLALATPATAEGALALVAYVAHEHAQGNDILNNYIGEPQGDDARETYENIFWCNVAAALKPHALA